MDKQKLKDNNIPSIEINKKQYFNLESVLEVFKEVKVDVEKVIQVDESYYVQAKDIHPTTEFDNKIAKALNFNPK